jgi:adenosylmethionine-8-amino-7-oxononanoate aminotransferase
MFAWIDTLIIAPPLIITTEEVDEAIAIIDKSLEIGDKETESTDVPLSKSSKYK